MANLNALVTQVQTYKSVEESAIQCIFGLAAKLDEARGSQRAIDGVITEMRAKASALATAIKANTDAPPPVEQPVETKETSVE